MTLFHAARVERLSRKYVNNFQYYDGVALLSITRTCHHRKF